MARPFSSVPGRAALALRDDVLLLRLATQARPTARRMAAGESCCWRAPGGTRRETPCHRVPDRTTGSLPWCTTPIEAESSLGPDSHHPIISLSGIPSAVMVLRILHPILASTLCAANPLARIAEPTIAL